MSYKQIK